MRRFGLVVFALLLIPVSAQNATVQPNRAAALEILALVNQWRMDEGLTPLVSNPLLERMAYEQASFVLPRLSSITDEQAYHMDARGQDTRQRAAALGYSNYGNPARTDVGENAASGSVAYAMRFWKNSDLHRRAALNVGYREAGVTALPIKNGFLIYMTFGARPNVYPVSLSVDSQMLYLTNEQSRYAAPDTLLRFRVFGADGQPLTPLMNWQRTFTLPTPLQSGYVVVTAGDQQSVVSLSHPQSEVILPDTLLSRAQQSADIQQASVVTATPPAATVVGTATPVAVLATQSPTSTPTVSAPLITLTLRISMGGMVLQNTSTTALDITNLEIGNASGSVNMTPWTRVAAFNTNRFSPQDCLVVSTGASSPATTGCRYVLSNVQYSAARAFWQQGDLEVRNNSVVITICRFPEATCTIPWN